MAMGKIGAGGRGFGKQGATSLGRAGGSGPVGPTAPVLTMDPSWDTTQATPIFDIDAAFADQDDLQFEYRVVGSPSWTVTNHTVTSGEISGTVITLGIGPLSNANYEARCKFKHSGGSYSDYSNTQAFTIAAAVATSNRITTAGDRRVTSAGDVRIYA